MSRGYDRKKARREKKNIPAAKGDKKCVLLHPECNILVMEKYESIKNWIVEKSIRGHYIFTKQDLCSAFPNMSHIAQKRAMSRLMAKKIIISPWHNFYVIVPTEYKLKSNVPPQFYLDQLMEFLDCPYYLALLNAAEMYGAAHQRPQNYAVFVSRKNLRSGIRAGAEILLYQRKRLPLDFIRKFQTQTGYMNVASPELTALDLVYAEQDVGGLSRVATVLAELVEDIHFSTVRQGLISFFSVSVVQRLGYLLDVVLEEREKADDLYALAEQEGLHFRKVTLKSSKATREEDEINCRWKIIVNQEIEVDEL